MTRLNDVVVINSVIDRLFRDLPADEQERVLTLLKCAEHATSLAYIEEYLDKALAIIRGAQRREP